MAAPSTARPRENRPARLALGGETRNTWRMAKNPCYHTIPPRDFTRFQNAEAEPERRAGSHQTCYTLLVAVELSAQATDAGVTATNPLFEIVEIHAMLDLGLDGLTEHIKSIGLFRQKAKNVMKLSPALVDDYDGVVPNSRAALHRCRVWGPQERRMSCSNMWWQYSAPKRRHAISFALGNRTPDAPGKPWKR